MKSKEKEKKSKQRDLESFRKADCSPSKDVFAVGRDYEGEPKNN